MTVSDMTSIWNVPKYLPYVQPDLTDQALKEAEDKIGYRLPTALIDLLKIQNGGYIRYKLGDTPHEKISGIGPYFPSLTDFDWEEYQDWVTFQLEALVPFDGDGHWFICLDYRESAEDPTITYIDTESDEQEKVANSFPEYIALLELQTEDSFVIKTRKPIEQVIAEIEALLEIKFEDPESFNYGYASYRSQYKSSWIWISPNEVPSGFIRDDDTRYNELMNTCTSLSLRFPEINRNYLLFNISEGHFVKEMSAKLTTGGIDIEHLKDVINQSPNA